MAEFKARTSAPSSTDKNYIHTSDGGYNPCIEIAGGSVLPNCVGYAFGRFMELLGSTPKLSTSNAENWWSNTADGYERGQTPKLGAVICWRKGKAGNESDGAGHVAIVEDVNSDGSIVTSNSAYGGTRFYTQTLSAPYNIGNGYHFQGFIYLPTDFKTTDTVNTDKSDLASSIGLEWWGDIVKVVLCILLIIIGLTLLVFGAKDTILKEVI